MTDQPDDLSYEDIEDAAWIDGEDLQTIDLDKLDDAIEAEADQPNKAAEGLLKTLDTLDEEIAPPAPKVKPPVRAPGRAPGRVSPRKTEHPAAPPVKEEEVQPETAPPPAPTPSPAQAEASAPTAPPAPADVGEPAEKPAPEKAPRSKPRERGPKSAAAPVQEPKPASTLPAVTPPVSPAAEVAHAGETGEVPPPAPPPDLIYRVQLNLPPELSTQVLELRKTGEITTMPQPGIQLTAGFRANDLEVVKTALAAWVRKQLPMQLETAGIWAEVIGAQQYIAAWTLQPEKDLRAAQRSLIKALTPLIVPLPDSPAEMPLRVIIGDQVAARRYPFVIGQMQRTFEPDVWHVTELHLIQCEAGTAPEAWAIAATFD